MLARQLSELPGEQVAKTRAAHIVIMLAALHEIHRHIERVVDIAFEAHAVLEGKRQHPGARAISVTPDFRAHRQKAVRLTIGKGRVGEHRGRDRLQRQPDAQFFDHVHFRLVVQIHLHRRSAEHHVETERADLGHVARHDRIALLRHDRHGRARPFRLHS